jgi:hypothetical protein
LFFQGLRRTLAVPRSVPGLVSRRLLVMDFLEGDQITRLGHRTRHLSAGCPASLSSVADPYNDQQPLQPAARS